MVVRVLGGPCTSPNARDLNRVLVRLKDGVLIVDCDLDIVSLGLSTKVLEQVFDEYLSRLEPSIADEIRATVEEVANGQD